MIELLHGKVCQADSSVFGDFGRCSAAKPARARVSILCNRVSSFTSGRTPVWQHGWPVPFPTGSCRLSRRPARASSTTNPSRLAIPNFASRSANPSSDAGRPEVATPAPLVTASPGRQSPGPPSELHRIHRAEPRKICKARIAQTAQHRLEESGLVCAAFWYSMSGSAVAEPQRLPTALSKF